MNVGSVVPFMGQGPGYGHIPAQSKLHTAFPMGKVGESNDPFLSDSQHLIQKLTGLLDGLKCMRHDYIVEGVFLKKLGDAFVQIGLDDRYSLGNTLLYVGCVNFQAVACHITGLAQMREQSAVTAAQVQDMSTWLDPFANDFQIRTQNRAHV